MNWLDTNTLISICACAIGLTQFLLWKYISKTKTYESEKGKNLATKEDIRDITQKVEEVKTIYATTLERYKVELQTEFETSKYVIELCNSLDKELIKLISEALKSYLSYGMEYPQDLKDKKLISSAYKISEFLYVYRTRYRSNENLKALNETAFNIKLLAEMNCSDFIPEQDKANFIFNLHAASSIFLPKFK